MTPSFSHLVTRFFTSFLAAEKGLAKNSIVSYADTMRLLVEHLCSRFGLEPEGLSVSVLSRETVLTFLDHLENDRGNCESTRNQRLAAIKTFFHFLARTVPELMQLNEQVQAIRAKKAAHVPPPSLTIEEVNAVIASPDATTLIGARDKALLQLLYNTGGRVQEIADLAISDLILGPAASVTLTGKRRKCHVVPIWPETVELVRNYLQFRERAGIQSEHLFLGKQSKPMGRSGIARRVAKHAEAAADRLPSLKDRNVTPHAFRHTIALHLLEAGNDVVVVKEWLGHADLKTTCLYLEISLDRKRKALEKVPPPSTGTEQAAPKWRESSIMDFLVSLSSTGHYAAKTPPKTPPSLPGSTMLAT